MTDEEVRLAAEWVIAMAREGRALTRMSVEGGTAFLAAARRDGYQIDALVVRCDPAAVMLRAGVDVPDWNAGLPALEVEVRFASRPSVRLDAAPGLMALWLAEPEGVAGDLGCYVMVMQEGIEGFPWPVHTAAAMMLAVVHGVGDEAVDADCSFRDFAVWTEKMASSDDPVVARFGRGVKEVMATIEHAALMEMAAMSPVVRH